MTSHNITFVQYLFPVTSTPEKNNKYTKILNRPVFRPKWNSLYRANLVRKKKKNNGKYV